MINDAIFSKSFLFRVFEFQKFRCSDRRSGIKLHYFLYMLKGTGKIALEDSDKTYQVNESDIFYIPKGAKFKSYWYGNPTVKFISIGFAFMPRGDSGYFEPQAIDAHESAKQMCLDLSLIREIDATAIGKLYTLAGELIPKMSLTRPDKRTVIVEKVKRYLNSNPHASVSELAKVAAISESALYLTFKTHSDTTINDYRQSVLMATARDLLISTDIPIEQIAETLRLSSSSYFRKCFKRQYGISPRQMRIKHEM